MDPLSLVPCLEKEEKPRTAFALGHVELRWLGSARPEFRDHSEWWTAWAACGLLGPSESKCFCDSGNEAILYPFCALLSPSVEPKGRCQDGKPGKPGGGWWMDGRALKGRK